jgi:predicted Zn-ribbon and HTH transcriptional regulator
MRKKPSEPPVPHERQETVRQEIMHLLAGGTLSAKEISSAVRVSEREVYDHLGHIQKNRAIQLRTTPAECRKCGFVFKKRQRLKKPGKCPVCKGELIQEPLFMIVK